MQTIWLMSGAGNRFAALDNRISKIPLNALSAASPILCHAPFADGLPTEGVIVLQASDGISRFDTTFFNPDGSTGAMCGNGARCAVVYAHKLSAISAAQLIQFTMAGNTYSANIHSTGISVVFPPAREIIKNLDVDLFGKMVNTTYVDVGSKHAVLFYEDLRQVFPDIPDDLGTFDLETFATPLRWHNSFAPHGVNVNVARKSLRGDGSLYLRTFERGVEGETGACGTGALATAIAGVLRGIVVPPVTIIPKSNRLLTVRMENSLPYAKLVLDGDAIFHDAIDVNITDKGQVTFADL